MMTHNQSNLLNKATAGVPWCHVTKLPLEVTVSSQIVRLLKASTTNATCRSCNFVHFR